MDVSFARLLVDYCLEAQAGDTILVEAETPALPLLPHLKRLLLQRGAYPFFRVSYPGEGRDFLLYGGAWLERIPEVERALYEKADKFLRILSAENPLEGASLDPGLSLKHQRAWRPLAELRLNKRWTLTLYPTVGYAVGAGMGTEEFREYLKGALFLDREDPVGAWRALSRFQEALIGRLSQGRELRIQAPGTDLRLSVAGRGWINSDGRRNMPSGEVFTGPLEDSAEGEVRFNLPAFVGG
ncbi:aminopeptidase, partial [Thermus scotoductus]|uniref:aminopeptidase n=1 Tax=Thermus scotoductus TaxID=37636 RepID=UPI000F7E5237